MSFTFLESKELLYKWGIRNKNILELLNSSSPEERFELMGWIYTDGVTESAGEADPNREKSHYDSLASKLKTYKKGWNSAFYKDQKLANRLNIQSAIESPEVEEGAYKCNRCLSMKTLSLSVQTRSGDEGMTNYIQCIECGLRWKE